MLYFFSNAIAQVDSIFKDLQLEADFRFRVEQDWNSKKSDGTLRDNRTRLRYRIRAGAIFSKKWYEVGVKIRTGNPTKQQDPQLTLGKGFEEFGTLPIGLEKAYFLVKFKKLIVWAGKNTFPFQKNNELFWSDNVYPEGVFASKAIKFKSSFIDNVDFQIGHFILSASNKSLEKDAYFQGFQVNTAAFKNRLKIFPSVYVYRNIPEIPDGENSYEIDYTILHIGTQLQLFKNNNTTLEFDYYYNLEKYNHSDSIPTSLKNQKKGIIFSLKHGKLSEKGSWTFGFSYAYLERYAALDYMAQNDWARWDYSTFGSPDGRLTNFQGVEIVIGYRVNKKIVLKAKSYFVKQLIKYGSDNENGNRIRFDIDIKI